MRGFAHKAILCFMMIFLLTGVTGCMNNKESVVDKMVAYMNKKYDDHFEYSAPFGGGPDSTSTQIIVTSEKYPEAEIWVEYYTKDSNEIFADNYVSYKYEEQTRELLQTLLNDVFHSNVKLQYGVGTKGTVNNFTDRTSFEEYASSPASRIGFRAFVMDDGMAISIAENELKEAIENSGFVLSGLIFITDDATCFETAFDLSPKELSQVMQMQISMDAPLSFLMYEWR